MNEDYTQPFCIVGSVGKFHPSYRFYLPPLEAKERQEILPIIPPEHRLYNELQQTKAKLNYLQNKLNEHLDKKKDTYVIK